MSIVTSYSHPEVLCETYRVAEVIDSRNENVLILEVDYDPEGHLPGAHLIWWRKDINDTSRRDIINNGNSRDLFPRLVSLQIQTSSHTSNSINGLQHLPIGCFGIMVIII